ncbi:SagB family peptide dehydrogenase [Paenibacillus sp. P25]|nr:SagB family peptide dehydrogenase [Paenibacillus sp. P25]
MSLNTFIHDLQHDPDRVRPEDWEADWADAPPPYKLYRGLPAVPLFAEVPLTLEGIEAPAAPGLREIGHLLWYAYGIAQYSQTAYPPESAESPPGILQMYRRFVPSGGALYPSEVYVYLKLGDLPAGVYHYDAAHHRLVLLREGRFDPYLNQALGFRCDMEGRFGAVFVSTVFWKNFFKYHNFAYRLQGLDAGVLIGQLLETANRFGITAAVCFQFLDRAVGHLLGLSQQEESVYAVIPLSAKPAAEWFGRGGSERPAVTSAELCREPPAVRHVHYVRSRSIREYPMLLRMNEASLLESTGSFRRLAGGGVGKRAALRRRYDGSARREAGDLRPGGGQPQAAFPGRRLCAEEGKPAAARFSAERGGGPPLPE